MLNTLNTSNTSDTLIIKILFRENLKHANTSNTSNTYTTFFSGSPTLLAISKKKTKNTGKVEARSGCEVRGRRKS